MQPMNWKAFGSWIFSAVCAAAASTVTTVMVLPETEVPHMAAIAGSTFVTALIQHIRSSPFTPDAREGK